MLQCGLLDMQCASTELAVVCQRIFRCRVVGSKALELGMQSCLNMPTLHDTYTPGAAAVHCSL